MDESLFYGFLLLILTLRTLITFEKLSWAIRTIIKVSDLSKNQREIHKIRDPEGFILYNRHAHDYMKCFICKKFVLQISYKTICFFSYRIEI